MQCIIKPQLNKNNELTRMMLYCGTDLNPEVAKGSFGNARWRTKEKCWSIPPDPVILRNLIDNIPNLELDEKLASILRAKAIQQQIVAYETQKTTPIRKNDKLWLFQRSSVRFLLSVKRGVLGHEMGTGKTVIAAAAIRQLEPAFGLIVCPNSVKFSWESYLKEWGCRKDVVILNEKMPTVKREDAIIEMLTRETTLMLILNYEQLRIHAKVLSSFHYDVIVCDEAHRIKNRVAARTEAVAKVARNADYVWMLTGTPARNTYTDVYMYLNICDPLRFSSYWGFINTYFETVPNMWGGVDIVGIRNTNTFHRMLSCYMYRKTKEEVMPELPPKIYVAHEIEMTEQQQKVYQKMEREFRAEINKMLATGEQIQSILTAPTTVAKIIRLRQICLTPELFGGIKESGKLNALADVVDDLAYQDKKFLIFTYFAEFIKHITRVLKDRGILFGVIKGGQKSEERYKLQQDLTQGKISCIVGTAQSMGEGMNLQAADTVVFTDIDWVPDNNRQAEDRVHRGDIKVSPTIIRLYHPKTVEEDIYNVCLRKDDIINHTIGGIETARQLLLRGGMKIE